MWKKFIKQYFSFNRGERNGLIVLTILLLIVIFLPELYRLFQEKNIDNQSKKNFEKKIQAFQEELKTQSDESNLPKLANHHEISIPRVELFSFDPNVVTFSECKKLGMSSKQANTLLNYRKAGGSFIYKEDLGKIYGINKKYYHTLEPYIKLPSRSETYIKKTPRANLSDSLSKRFKERKSYVNINNAGYHELEELYGIGEVLAKRIIKYRDLLGGFHDEKQILEVFGITGKTYELIQDNIHAEGELSRLNINKATYKDLLRHPYLNKYQVDGILSLRKIMGEIDSVELLMVNNILPDSVYQKIHPYLDR